MITTRNTTIVLSICLSLLWATSCTNGRQQSSRSDDPIRISTNINGTGNELIIIFKKGSAINHPLMAIWAEDTTEKYIQTFYVSSSIATSIFDKVLNEKGKWSPGLRRAPAALPIWSHDYGYVASDGLYLPEPSAPVADAYSGATPGTDFDLTTRSNEPLPEIFDLYFEINQPWDWNDYWHNARFPDSPEYLSSAQPSLLYHARINTHDKNKKIALKVIGHGHYAGADGILYIDLSTFTTALKITKSIEVILK